jgi:hypothetical protein
MFEDELTHNFKDKADLKDIKWLLTTHGDE